MISIRLCEEKTLPGVLEQKQAEEEGCGVREERADPGSIPHLYLADKRDRVIPKEVDPWPPIRSVL
jgi:hypothetical protein